ncbi:MAG: 4Fe-4S binding protein [Deltaproteobacteria bacterium]|nr:4Fe-4S binding protein [Deltaproteobacteria bacterium]
MKPRQKLRKGIILVSFFLFPATFYYLSPVLIIQAAINGVINGSFILFLLMFLSALVLGRGYCGWVCPGAGCQEALFSARNNRVKKGDYVKWLIWVPWVGAIVILAVRGGGYSRIDFFYQTTHGLSIGDLGGLIAYLMVLFLLIVLPALIFGRRSFCHHLCWMAPFMILGREIRNVFEWPSLLLKAEAEKCTHCHTCTENCPMSLPVENMVQSAKMENSECILCGTCIDGCPAGVIQYDYRTGKNRVTL